MVTEAEIQLKAATQAGERSAVAAAYRQLGYLYLQQGSWDDALGALRMAADLMPTWSFVHRHLAHLYAREGDWIQAAAELESAIRHNPELGHELRRELAAAHYRAGLYWFNTGDWQQAAASFENAVRHRQDLAPGHHYLAHAYAHLGAWARARAAIETAARLSPGDALVNENLERIRTRRPPRIPGSTAQPE
jgi:Tfp pilus assembly protein PilF